MGDGTRAPLISRAHDASRDQPPATQPGSRSSRTTVPPWLLLARPGSHGRPRGGPAGLASGFVLDESERRSTESTDRQLASWGSYSRTSAGHGQESRLGVVLSRRLAGAFDGASGGVSPEHLVDAEVLDRVWRQERCDVVVDHDSLGD